MLKCACGAALVVVELLLGQSIGDTPRPGKPDDVRSVQEMPNTATEFECGTISLYTLLRLEGRPLTLSIVENALPPPPAVGYSLADLRAASSKLGLPLIGVKVPLDFYPKRPVLVFLSTPEHGHFVVIRPVGRTKKLIQVLDSRHDPDVLDADDFFRTPGWTGMALVPSRSSSTPNLMVGMSGLIIGVMVICGGIRSRARKGGKG